MLFIFNIITYMFNFIRHFPLLIGIKLHDTRHKMQYYIRLNKEKRLIVMIRQKKFDLYVTDNYQ